MNWVPRKHSLYDWHPKQGHFATCHPKWWRVYELTYQPGKYLVRCANDSDQFRW